jgi:hypothetical protein
MTDMSPADIAVAAGRNNNDGCFGGNSWVLIILFALIFGWGGMGFGGNGAQGAALTESALCNSQNFNNLENSVGRLSDQLNNTYMGLQNGMSQMGYSTLQQFGQTQRDMCTGFSAVTAAVNSAAAQAAECCCNTNRNIDQLRYDGAMNTASINATTTAQTQKILDAICENRMADMQSQINQLQLQSALCGVVRYPSATTYSAGTSIWGNGCACSASI